MPFASELDVPAGLGLRHRSRADAAIAGVQGDDGEDESFATMGAAALRVVTDSTRIRKVRERIDQHLQDLATPRRVRKRKPWEIETVDFGSSPPPPEPPSRDLGSVRLAQAGWQLFDELVQHTDDGGAALAKAERLQVVSSDLVRMLPVELVYDGEPAARRRRHPLRQRSAGGRRRLPGVPRPPGGADRPRTHPVGSGTAPSGRGPGAARPRGASAGWRVLAHSLWSLADHWPVSLRVPVAHPVFGDLEQSVEWTWSEPMGVVLTFAEVDTRLQLLLTPAPSGAPPERPRLPEAVEVRATEVAPGVHALDVPDADVRVVVVVDGDRAVLLDAPLGGPIADTVHRRARARAPRGELVH